MKLGGKRIEEKDGRNKKIMAKKKPYKRAKKKLYKSTAHGTVYAKMRGLLVGHPMFSDEFLRFDTSKGEYDKKNWGIIEESPKSFKQTHYRARKRLGILKATKKQVTYY